jgi:hypothetical protein
MTIHWRSRRIRELLRRYQPVTLNETLHRVVDSETSLMVEDAAFETRDQAETKCRDLLVADIERLFAPDRATAVARIAAIIGEQSDPQWAAKVIVDYWEGAKR